MYIYYVYWSSKPLKDSSSRSWEPRYWLRQKMAAKISSKGFDHSHFLAEEKQSMLRRQKRKAKEQKIKEGRCAVIV